MTDGAKRIAAERKRQINEEGWDAKHDANHCNGSLVRAAVCYATEAIDMTVCEPQGPVGGVGTVYLDPWPWDQHWDKRKKHNRIRQLEIAGALIAAEIDRLLASDPEEP